MAKSKKNSKKSGMTSPFNKLGFLSKSKKSASLDPTFDEVNETILLQLDNDPDSALVCSLCGQEFIWDIDWVGTECSEPGCRGKLLALTGEDDVIELSPVVKSGYKGHQQDNWNGSAADYSSTTYKACSHKGDKIIFERGNKKLYGSNATSLNEFSGAWDLIIDLAGVITLPSVSGFVSANAPKRFKDLSKFTLKDKEVPSEVLRLYWTDMGVPPVGLQFWQELWNLLPEKTVIVCQGGHGRTGSCLASLMITAGIDYYSALETVRAEHCNKAVESVGQEKYLHALYMDVIKQKLEELRANSGAIDLIKEYEEDLKYAQSNVPEAASSSASKNYSKKEWPAPIDAGVKIINAGNEKVTYYAPNSTANLQLGTPLADARSSGRAVKVVGDKIFVEECIAKNCIVVNCNQNSHQDWIEWDLSLSKTEWAVNSISWGI